MKIAIVHYAAAPVIGGVERIIEEHARLLSHHGHIVTILCQRGTGTRITPGTLLNELRKHDIAIVHNVFTMPFDLALTEALWLAPSVVRTIAWTHDIAAANPDLAPVPSILTKAAPGVEYVTISALRQLQLRATLGIENARIIPNGVDPNRILDLPLNVAALVEREHLFDASHILIHPTRLLRRKNVETSIRLAQIIPDTRLIITGPEDPHNPASADYARSLRNLAGPETIFASDHFPVGDTELAALYRVADALIFPSHQEGFGLPLLEARIHRLPAIYSEIEPLTELAGPGFPISPGEPPDAIARRIAPWLVTISDKRRALAEYAWPEIYRRHMQSLFDPCIPPIRGLTAHVL